MSLYLTINLCKLRNSAIYWKKISNIAVILKTSRGDENLGTGAMI